jgi:hypothetical protein
MNEATAFFSALGAGGAQLGDAGSTEPPKRGGGGFAGAGNGEGRE